MNARPIAVFSGGKAIGAIVVVMVVGVLSRIARRRRAAP